MDEIDETLNLMKLFFCNEIKGGRYNLIYKFLVFEHRI